MKTRTVTVKITIAEPEDENEGLYPEIKKITVNGQPAEMIDQGRIWDVVSTENWGITLEYGAF